jgi:hypothetical protein
LTIVFAFPIFLFLIAMILLIAGGDN